VKASRLAVTRRTLGEARRRCRRAVRRPSRRWSCDRRPQGAPVWRQSTGTVHPSNRYYRPPSPRPDRSPLTTFQTERCADPVTRSPTVPPGICERTTTLLMPSVYFLPAISVEFANVLTHFAGLPQLVHYFLWVSKVNRRRLLQQAPHTSTVCLKKHPEHFRL